MYGPLSSMGSHSKFWTISNIALNSNNNKLFKGPYKWTFFKTSLLHVFYQFWHADYEYDIFKIKKNGNYDFWIVKKGPSAPAMRPAHRHKKKWRPVRWKQCSQRTSEAFYSFPHKKMKFWGEDLSIYKICWFWQIFALVHR